MRPSLTFAAVLASASLAVPTAIRADTFDYSYTGSEGSTTFTFNYDSPAVITTPILLSAGAAACSITGPNTPVCNGVTLIPVDNELQIDYTETIMGTPVSPTLTDTGSTGLFTVGTHTTTDGTLTVTDIPSVVPTPEPSGIVLLSTGLLGLAGLARRRVCS